MKILQLIPYFTPKRGGDVNVCYNLSKQLAKLGCGVTIITTDFEFDEIYAESLDFLGIKVLPFHQYLRKICDFPWEVTSFLVKDLGAMCTDGWKGYDTLMFCGYRHLSIDHRYKFKAAKMYINKIEGFWSFAKELLIEYHGISPPGSSTTSSGWSGDINKKGKDSYDHP